MKHKLISILDRFTEYCLYAMVFFIPISKAAIESFFGFVLLGFLLKKIIKPDFKFFKSIVENFKNSIVKSKHKIQTIHLYIDLISMILIFYILYFLRYNPLENIFVRIYLLHFKEYSFIFFLWSIFILIFFKRESLYSKDASYSVSKEAIKIFTSIFYASILVGAIIFFVQFKFFSRKIFLGGFISLFIFLCGLRFMIRFSLIRAGVNVISKSIRWENFFLLLFLFFSVLSLLNSGPYLIKGFKALFFKWGEYILIFWLIQDTLSNRQKIKNALGVFLFAAVITGIDGVAQRLFGSDFLRHMPILRLNHNSYAITSAFNYYNDFGIYLTVILALIIALFISKQTKRSYRWILAIEGILLWWCLLLTYSRGAWLGFIYALLLMLLLSRRFKELVFFISIFIIVIVLTPAFKERGAFIFQPGGDADRFIIWQSAMRMIKENPFLGKGIGTFMDYFHLYVPRLCVQYAHNCYLQIWAETGIFSLLSFLGFLSVVFFKGMIAFEKSQDSFILGILCGIFGFLVHSFFDTHLYSLQLSVLFWSMAGILCSLIKFQN